jgi:hypothetical protein
MQVRSAGVEEVLQNVVQIQAWLTAFLNGGGGGSSGWRGASG